MFIIINLPRASFVVLLFTLLLHVDYFIHCCFLTRRITSKFVLLFINLICLNLISPGSASRERRVSGLMPALLLMMRCWRFWAAARVCGFLLLSRLDAKIRAALSSIAVLLIGAAFAASAVALAL